MDLSAGAGAENPPCPACGEPLFGWAIIRPAGEAVRRCELCGMAVVGPVAERSEAQAALAAAAAGACARADATGSRAGSAGAGAGDGAGAGALPNRNSVQAWVGSSGWAGLRRDSRFAFTPDAAWRLDYIPGRPRPAVLLFWQTLINSFTFGHNLALGALGRSPSTPAGAGWQRALDRLITGVTALPLLIVAVAIELPAWAAGRGGRFAVNPGPDRIQDS
ncbi:MAG TPA: hypothetical protein VFD37_07105 [Solirubrobacterales bacterium]|nr:hypothetical protein [Solirubrobacterales bacterium]